MAEQSDSKRRREKSEKESAKKKKKKKRKLIIKHLENELKEKLNSKLQTNSHSSSDDIPIIHPLPHYFQVHHVLFKDSYFDDHAFMYKPHGAALLYPEVVGSVTHIADETTTLDSPDCRRYTMFAVDDFNISNKKKLELVNILNVNRMVCCGYLAFTRFVAKDLDTQKTAIYRAGVHEFGFYTRLVHFKAEESDKDSFKIKINNKKKKTKNLQNKSKKKLQSITASKIIIPCLIISMEFPNSQTRLSTTMPL